MTTIEEALGSAVAARLAEVLAPLIEAVDRLQGQGPQPEVFTVDEAAVVLATSPATVRKWVNAGHLPRLPATSSVLIPRRSVMAFIDEAAERSLAHRGRGAA